MTTRGTKNRERDRYFSVPDLRERAWTTTAIEKFLPREPDATQPNPHFSRAGDPMRLWLKSRVKRVEKTKRFLTWKAGAAARKRASLQGVITRTCNIVEEMEAAEITIERGLTDQEIHDLAYKTHGGNYLGDPGPFYWSTRTARKCIRHNLTNYDNLLATICNRGESGQEAHMMLQRRVGALIDEAYPQFTGRDEGYETPTPGRGRRY